MKFIKELKKIIISILVAMMIIATSPIIVLGANDTTAPVITQKQKAGEILISNKIVKFKITDNTKIAYIFYAWDRHIEGKKDYTTYELPTKQAETEYTIELPKTLGFHELSIAAQDIYGNKTYWMNIPYVLVDKLSGVEDNIKPRCEFNILNGEYPYHNSTISQGMPITVRAKDNLGIYYIGYTWRRELKKNDTPATLIYSDIANFTAPEQSGEWYLIVYARDYSNNVSSSYATRVYIRETAYTELENKLSNTSELVPGDYTSESWEQLQDVIKETEKMIADNKSTQKQVDEQITKLENTINNTKAIDKTELNNYIDSLEEKDYAEGSWANLMSLVEIANNQTLQSKFDKKVEEVKAFTLQAKQIDTTKLDAIEADLAKLTESDYTSESWKDIQDKITDAKKQTLQSKFDEIVDEINLNTLVELPRILEIEGNNDGYRKVDEQITITVKTNKKLIVKPSLFIKKYTTATFNGNPAVIEEIPGEQNKYTITYTIKSTDIDANGHNGHISYVIKPIAEDNVEGQEVTGNINISDYLTEIKIKTVPTKISYKLDDESIDLSEGKIKLIMASGTARNIDMSSEGVTVTGFDTNSVGTKTITVSYEGKTATFDITVAKKDPSRNDLTIDASALNVEYDGTSKTIKKEQIVKEQDGMGEINQEEIKYYQTINGKETEVEPKNVGTYTIRISIGEGEKYNARSNFAVGTLTIEKATPKASDFTVSNNEVPYTGTAQIATVSAKEGIEGLGTITPKYYDEEGKFVENPTNAGTYTIKVTTNGATNYEDVTTELPLETKLIINPKEITVKADDVRVLYGNVVKEFKYKEVGENPVLGKVEDLGIVLKTVKDNEDITIGKTTPVGTYTITGESKVYGNYKVTVQSGTYTILARPITVKATDVNATYGEEGQKLTYTEVVEGSLVNGENITVLGDILLKTTKKNEDETVTDITIGKTTPVGTYTITGTNGVYGNYNVTIKEGTYTIGKSTTKLTASDFEVTGDTTVTYDGQVHKVQVNAKAGIDGIGTIIPKYYDEEGNLIENPTNAGTYTIKVTTTGATNYADIAEVDNIVLGALTINTSPITVTISNKNSIYGDSLATLESNVTSGTVVAGDDLGITLRAVKVTEVDGQEKEEALTVATGVGEYAIRGTATNTNYNVRFVDGTYTINPKEITVKADDIRVLYGNRGKALTYTEVEEGKSALVNGENITALGDILLKTKNGDEDITIEKTTPVGTYTITGTDGIYGNYKVTVQPGTYTILARPITVKATDVNATYGEEGQELTYTEVIANGKSALVNEEQLTVLGNILKTTKKNGDETVTDITIGKTTPVGTYTITGTNGVYGNYNVTIEDGTYTITKANVTVTIDNKTSVYGEEIKALTSTITPEVSEEELGLTYKILDASGQEIDLETTILSVGTYGITIDCTNTNYNVTKVTATYTVTAKAITVKATDVNATYGEEGQGLTYSEVIEDGKSSALVNGEAITILGNILKTTKKNEDETIGNITIGKTTPVGTYTITGTNGVYGNYNVTIKDGEYIIGAKAITVKATDVNATYGQEGQGLIYSEVIENGKSALVNEEKITVLGNILKTTKKNEDETVTDITIGKTTPVGTYTITGESKVYGNYNVTIKDGKYIIGAKAIKVQATSVNATYGEEGKELTYTEVIADGKSALVNEEKITVLGNILKTTKKNEDETVTDITIGKTTPVGTYTITGTNGVYGNYNVTIEEGTYTITKANVTVTIDNKTSVYGEEIKTLTSTITPEVSEEELGLTYKILDASGQEIDLETTILSVGTYGITVDCTNTNYNVTKVTATYTVTAKTPTADDLEFDLRSKPYTGKEQALTVTAKKEGLLGEIIVKYDGGTTAPTNAGTYKVTVDIAAGTNYGATTIELGTYTITKKKPSKNDFTIDPNTLEVEYDGNPKAITITPITGMGSITSQKYHPVVDGVEKEALEGAPKNVGQYVIRISVAESGNYTARDNFNVGTLTITPSLTKLTASDFEVAGDRTVTYDGQEHTVEVTAKEGIDGVGTIVEKYYPIIDGVVSTEAVTPKNAGTYTIKVTTTGATNYANIAEADNIVLGTLTINPSPITVTISNKNSIYGDPLATLESNVTSGTVVTGDDLGIALRAVKVTTVDEQEQEEALKPTTGIGTTYKIKGTATNTNYDITFVDGTYTVTARPVTIAIENKESVYGDKIKDLTYTITSGTVVNEDNLGIVLEAVKIVGNEGHYIIPTTAVGDNYVIRVNEKLTTSNPNYEITVNNTGTYKITARPITIKADDITATYGGEGQKLTYTEVVEGSLVNGENITVLGDILLETKNGDEVITIGKTTPVGTYTITGESKVYGNYDVTIKEGTYTIGKSTTKLTASDFEVTGDTTVTYDGQVHKVQVNAKPGIDGVGTIIPKYYDEEGNFVENPTNAGTYTIKVTTTGATNYADIAEADNIVLGTTLTINQKAITVIAEDKSSIIGATELEPLTVRLATIKDGEAYANNTLIEGDNLGDLLKEIGDTLKTFPMNPVDLTKPGRYMITGPDGQHGNYYVTIEEGTYTVTAKEIIVIAENKSSVYGATTPEDLTVKLATGEGYENNTLFEGDNEKELLDAVKATLTTNPVLDLATATVGKEYKIIGESKVYGNYTVKVIPGTYTIIAKTPTVADLDFDLTSKPYTGTEQALTVTAKEEGVLGEITVKYNGETTAPVNAGTYKITVDIAEGTNYTSATIELGNYEIRPISIQNASVATNPIAPIYKGDTIDTSKIISSINKVKVGESVLVKGKDYELDATQISYIECDSSGHTIGENYTTKKPTEVGLYKARILAKGKGNYTGTRNIYVSPIEIKAVEISKVDIENIPSPLKTEYKYNEDFDLEDWKVCIYYNNDTEKIISLEEALEKEEITLEGYSKTTVGEQEVKIKYKETEILMHKVTVKNYITEIEAKPYKVVYEVGDTLDINADIDVIAYRADKNGEFVTDKVKLEGYDLSKPGSQTVTVSYTDNDENSATKGTVFTTTFGIAVVPKATEESPENQVAIVLNGQSNVKIEVGKEYKEEGATIYNLDSTLNTNKDIKVAITGTVDTSKVGTYEITYSITSNISNINAQSVTRIVEVVDTIAPEIKLSDTTVSTDVVEVIDSEKETLITFTKEKATFDLNTLVNVTDNYVKTFVIGENVDYTVTLDGNVVNTTTIGTEVGEYVVTYTATDLSRNKSTKIVKFKVLDYPPIIYYLDENGTKQEIIDGQTYKNHNIELACDKENINIWIKTYIDGEEVYKQYNNEMLEDGTYTIHIEGKNINSVKTFTIDTTPPIIEKISITNKTIKFKDPSDVYSARLTSGDGKNVVIMRHGEYNQILEDGTYIITNQDIITLKSTVVILYAEDEHGNKMSPIYFQLN